MIIGIIVLILAGICQGSFGLGFKKYQPFAWEAFYFICSLLFGIIPACWLAIQVPDFLTYFQNAEMHMIFVPLLCGAFWGLTSIGFTKGVDFIGMSLVYGLSMGISAVIGSLTPMVVKQDFPETSKMICLVIGIIITLVGIAVITKAGLIKEQETKTQQDKKNSKTKLGIFLAMFSGLGSGAMNIGFDFTSSLTGDLNEIQASALKWILVLVGGSITSAAICAVMMWKNKTWYTLTEKGAVKELGILIITCIVWFIALDAYGIASGMLGKMGPVAGWIFFNALALIISNAWGVKTGEWNASKQGKRWLLIGNAVLIVSWIFVGLSNI